jgi:hypothetical protein
MESHHHLQNLQNAVDPGHNNMKEMQIDATQHPQSGDLSIGVLLEDPYTSENADHHEADFLQSLCSDSTLAIAT